MPFYNVYQISIHFGITFYVGACFNFWRETHCNTNILFCLAGQYQRDINVDNPLGHGGEVARAYAQFLKQMWIGKQSSFSPLRLKVLTGEKITSMFMGHNQHDAQEFMSFFLDAVHEDLNKNKDRPKINYNDDDVNAEKELFNASDLANDEKRREIQIVMKQKADDMWKQYRLFNNSIIIDLFCGQFKSIISCPDCSKVCTIFMRFHNHAKSLTFLI